jgi:hypothetical protein
VSDERPILDYSSAGDPSRAKGWVPFCCYLGAGVVLFFGLCIWLALIHLHP